MSHFFFDESNDNEAMTADMIEPQYFTKDYIDTNFSKIFIILKYFVGLFAFFPLIDVALAERVISHLPSPSFTKFWIYVILLQALSNDITENIYIKYYIAS